MNATIVTVVDAMVDEDRVEALIDGYRELMAGPAPDGFCRSELLRGQDGAWRIQTSWRDRAALMALRESGSKPAALELLDRVGATHTHAVFTVEQEYGG